MNKKIFSIVFLLFLIANASIVFANTSCSAPYTGLQNAIKEAYINPQGDYDWHEGYISGTQNIKVILSIPAIVDYDVEIYDTCTNGSASNLRKTCSAGTGQLENDSCTATVTDYYYVKVFPKYSFDYSGINPYRIRSGSSATCTLNGSNGTPSQGTYLCNEDIKINNYYFDNSDILNNYTDYVKINDLYNSQNNLVYDPAYTGTLGWLSNQTYSVTHAVPGSSWTWHGYYDPKSTIFGKCANSGIDAVQIFSNPKPFVSLGHDYYSCYQDDVWSFTACNIERFKTQECGSDSCDSWNSNYCSGNKVFKDRTCYDKGCSSSSCFSNSSTDSQLVQDCSSSGQTCSNGTCVGGSSCNPIVCNQQDNYDSWEYYCANTNDLWKKQKFNDYSCSGNQCSLQSNNYTNQQFVQTCSNGCSNNSCAGQQNLTTSITPKNPTSNSGQSTFFSSNTSGGSSNYTYLWSVNPSTSCSNGSTIGSTFSVNCTNNGSTQTSRTINLMVTGGGTVSDSTNLYINPNVPKLSVVINPGNATVNSGQSQTFDGNVSGGNGNYTYSWILNNYSDCTNSSNNQSTFTVTCTNPNPIQTGRLITLNTTDGNMNGSSSIYLAINGTPQVDIELTKNDIWFG